MPSLCRLPLLSMLPLLPCALLAQPSATMRSALLESLAFEVSGSSSAAVERAGVNYGDVSVLTSSASVSGQSAVNPTTLFAYGAAFLRHDLETETRFLPRELMELSINVGLRRQWSPAWSGAVYLRPGYYGEELNGDSFNLPALLMATWGQSPALAWNFGANVNAFSEYPVLPIAGMRWQFAPDWTFNVGFPQSGFSWRFRETVTLRAGVSFNGGSYRVSRERASPESGVTNLTNTLLDYREVRLGIGAEIALRDGVVLVLNAGGATDRKFDYFDRDFLMNGEAGFYAGVAVRATF